MHVATGTSVVFRENNELFNAVSVYLPMSLAAANIVDFNPAWVSAQRPAVFTCEVSNYDGIMKGRLLDQWTNAFRQKTNVDLVIYLIVFLDDASTAGMWEIDDVSIRFAPLTSAFKELFFLSYLKVLFDEHFDGRPVTSPPYAGSPASAGITLENGDGSNPVTVPAGNYLFNDGVKDWVIPIDVDIVIPASGSVSTTIHATTVGDTAALTAGALGATVTPSLPANVSVEVDSVTQGENPGSAPTETPSKYFDLSLALSYQCKLDSALSCFWTLVKVSLPKAAVDTNYCLIASKTAAEEREAMLSIQAGDRAKYYWGALFLMECANTWVAVHSEPVNIIPEILAMWFTARNPTKLYVGNKVHMIRLSGTRIKPLGYPSWISSDVNVNDPATFAILDEKRVGYLMTISDKTVQDSAVSSARGITGLSMNAVMISKYIDYSLAQDFANMVTDAGTLTNPVLTDQEAYEEVQRLTYGKVGLFTKTKRIFNIVMKFPQFSDAKTGLTSLTAATSWSANYKDDLDEITLTGGITEE
jgi:hypothetical protein